MKTFGLLHGPNLDRLGKRETAIYGKTTLADLEKQVASEAKALGVKIETFQSNHEGAMIDQVARWADAGVAGIILNAGALTHTSIALRDAIAGCNLPCVEVHISNIYKREEFRHKSLTAGVCLGIVSGLGVDGYFAAVRFLAGLKK